MAAAWEQMGWFGTWLVRSSLQASVLVVLILLAQRLLRLFVELNKSGTSVVIATHDIALMDQFDARRLVLHEGRLHVYD